MHASVAGPMTAEPIVRDDRSDDPCLELEGIEGSVLRATIDGLTVVAGGEPASIRGDVRRHWAYHQLDGLRLDAYGPIGVIRAKVQATGTDLPLLLLEPSQITAARRSLEVIWNLMAPHDLQERAS